MTPHQLQSRIANTAFTFRGYNTTNLGKSAELLEHPAYGPLVAQTLREGSTLASDVLHRRIDLLERVHARRETTDLDTYAEDIALIVCMSLVQLKLLEEYHAVAFQDSHLTFGYSLGEPTALVAGGVYNLEPMLTAPLLVAEDCVALAHDVTMGVLFSRGPEFDEQTLLRACLEITAEGKGVIAPSTFLSPNSVLLLGQGNTIDRFKELMKDRLPEKAHLRKNPHRWPPLHTPIMWQRNIPNRAAVYMQTVPGGFKAPIVPTLSSVTGQRSFNDLNSRELLIKWVDHPQRLWDMVCETLASGVEVVIHVGPDPNLVPATFKRISDNVAEQLAGRSWNSLGLRAFSHIVRRQWLTRLLYIRTALLRAPFVEHVILEDWLLANSPTLTTSTSLPAAIN
jgi:[acyl-carrier-protein] S-malonyltransferase